MRIRNTHFKTDRLNAGEALNRAHFLALAPFAFEAALTLRDSGILSLLEARSDAGITAEEVAAAAQMPLNSAHAILEAGLGTGLIAGDEGRFYLTMTGQYFLQNETVRANADFMRDVCLPGMSALEESLHTARPQGLKALTDDDNIFEALSHLPERVRRSWYAFNNHHSDTAFADALPIVLAEGPERILDIGGGAGRFALAALDRDDAVHIGIAELNADEVVAEPGMGAAIRAGRVSLYPHDVLETGTPLPEGYDTIWMSQFLPCFSEEEIAAILAKCAASLPAEGRLWLLETFWDRQRHEAAAIALQMTSLYFVNIATGHSRMWRSDALLEMVADAGFTVVSERDGIGRGHTLIQLRKA